MATQLSSRERYGGRAWVCEKCTPASHGNLEACDWHGNSRPWKYSELGGKRDFGALSQRVCWALAWIAFF